MRYIKIYVFGLLFITFFCPARIFGFIAMPGDSSQSMPFNVQHSYPTIKNDASSFFEQDNISSKLSVPENDIVQSVVNEDLGDNNEPSSVQRASISFWVIIVILFSALGFFVFNIFTKK